MCRGAWPCYMEGGTSKGARLDGGPNTRSVDVRITL